MQEGMVMLFHLVLCSLDSDTEKNPCYLPLAAGEVWLSLSGTGISQQTVLLNVRWSSEPSLGLR